MLEKVLTNDLVGFVMRLNLKPAIEPPLPPGRGRHSRYPEISNYVAFLAPIQIIKAYHK